MSASAVHKTLRTQILVIGSGAGGAATAATLAEHGYDVLVLEEGPDVDTARLATNSTQAIRQLYRNGGMTPILGNQTIAYVEGRCVGGSTEINSAFWHRLPQDSYHRWSTDAQLQHFSPAVLEPYFERLERELSVSHLHPDRVPRSSVLFRAGIEKMRWDYVEVPRCQRDQEGSSAFAPGAKQSMQRTYLPRALQAGATLLPDCKAQRLLLHNGRVNAVLASRYENGSKVRLEIRADSVFVCCGAVQTPALLRRSGIKQNVGNNLCIHPMIKAAAVFNEEVEAHEAALPIYQVKEFWPTITLGGAVFSPGFLAMLLSDNWPMYGPAMRDWQSMALYYAASRGMSRGRIRVLPTEDGVVVRYHLSEADRQNLATGLARLGEVLFAAGAKAVYPSLFSHPVLKSADQCRGLLKSPPPIAAMSLSTVHAFSSCPMGENPDLCATDSFGKVRGLRNLWINDASLLPDSPGVNPQGTTMAIALRNLDHFLSAQQARPAQLQQDGPRRSAGARRTTPAQVLVTGAPGWLGTRLVEALCQGLPDDDRFAASPDPAVRCLVHPDADAAPLAQLHAGVQIHYADLRDSAAMEAFFEAAEGAVLFHVAGIVHPRLRTAELEEVNVHGTARLLALAEKAGIRRIVAVSSNSPLGCNPHPEHVFDETCPYQPYMAYGRSKVRMEGLVKEAQARGRIETVIVRPPWFYGPHQPARQTTFFQMIKAGRFPLLGDGRQRRSMAYVDNTCQGLLLAARTPQAAGQTYWIADARPYTMNEIVDTVREVMETEFKMACAARQLRLPAVVGKTAQMVDGLIQSLGLYEQRIHVLGEMDKTIACSIAKAQRELGYAPKIELREGMRRSIEWCLANGQHI
jgi:nucleoside-diphosphate-sugar epimerase